MSFAGVHKGEKSMKKAQDFSFWEKPGAFVFRFDFQSLK